MRLRRFLRNRALRLSRRMSSPVRDWRLRLVPNTVALDEVRRRLELLLVAMYDVPFRVASVATAADSDIALPTQLDASAGRDDTIVRYRLLALLQASRLVRANGLASPPDDAIARDLHRLAESAAAERDVVTRVPALAPTLSALRFAELASRPKAFRLTHSERRVEMLLRELLASPPDRIPASIAASDDPDASRAWAESTAEEIKRESGGRSPYRPRNPMSLWGLAWSRRGEQMEEQLGGGGGGSKSDPASQSRSRDENGARKGEGDDPDDGEMRDEQGETARRAETDPGTDAEAAKASRSTSGGADSSNDAHITDAASDETIADAKRTRAEQPPADGIAYPEWDEIGKRIRAHGATVSCSVAEGDDDRWAADTLREHAPLVRQLRDRFAPLRAQRLRLRRQRAGDELDLDACVAALTDRRKGFAPSDRLYQVVRPTRHSVAILLLVDASGSTNGTLDDGRSVFDVERTTLLLASEALAMLGDPYAMLAFSGAGRHGVRVSTVKGFDDHDDVVVRRRISALVARDNTRLGAAVRHATAVLGAQHAQRRILLIVSDGKPNDVEYQGSSAIEDSRRALNDARAAGVHPFCLTVDREEHEYLPHLFGRNGYRVLHRPEQLPEALLRVVDGMLRE